MVSHTIRDYFGCPTEFASFRGPRHLGIDPASIEMGDARWLGCFDVRGGTATRNLNACASDLVYSDADGLQMPFDVDEVVENLRRERYLICRQSSPVSCAVKSLYYALRLCLPIAVRKHLQRFHLRKRRNTEFPKWPIDDSVDVLMRELLTHVAQHRKEHIPFIWFWPDGNQSCVAMTHDVEHEAGRAFCTELMSIDESYGIVSSFQVVPEERYRVTDTFLEEIRARGFELNVHDLTHRCDLFRNRLLFLQSIPKLRGYADLWRARGFRAGAMYRNPDLIAELPFAYDMSYPSAAHLEPQAGGCCTVMPYFLGDVVELPLTTTQDYTLLHILRQTSIDLWKQEIEALRERNALITFIIHPDYVIDALGRRLYIALLEHLVALRRQGTVWFAKPGQVADWWRLRSRMSIVREAGQLRIVGPGADRARLAFARVGNDGFRIELCNKSPVRSDQPAEVQKQDAFWQSMMHFAKQSRTHVG
jgi:hypothetical protein